MVDRPLASAPGPPSAAPVPREREVAIPAERVTAPGEVTLPGDLAWLENPAGVVVFAHGSGSSRKSPRNIEVARAINAAGLATLLFDLLTPQESANRELVFDIPLLGARLLSATAWLRGRAEAGLPAIGYFGASTGAAAARWAAAEPGNEIGAVVSRGGRPDLASERLPRVEAATLLVAGGDDHVVLDLNRRAQALLRCENDLVVIPGAGHLFEEPGALEEVATHAARWFVSHLGPGRSTVGGAEAG